MDPVIVIGTKAPDFSLPGLQHSGHAVWAAPGTQNYYRMSAQNGKIVVLNFWSAECPWAERVDHELAGYMADWEGKVCWWSVAANANESEAIIAAAAEARRLPVVLIDAGQKVANLYGAQATPHMFVVDERGILRYQGAFDDVTFRQRKPAHFYLREAVDALLAGRQPVLSQTPAYGCAIVRSYSE